MQINQTSTYKVGTTKRWVCPRCGAQKDAKAMICINCRNIDRNADIPDVSVIIAEMKRNGWNYSAAGRTFGVSDNAVRKWCKKFDLKKADHFA